MVRREIERALRAKDIQWSILEYNHQVTPGEVVGGWDIVLTDECEEQIAAAAPGFDDWEPDCFNAAEVLEWVAMLPDLTRDPNLNPEDDNGNQ